MDFNISNALKESIICDEYQLLSPTSIISRSLLNSPVIPLDILVSASVSMTEFVEEVWKILKEPMPMENQLITEPKLNAHKTVDSMKKKEKKKKMI